jgi:hypothetical protein
MHSAPELLFTASHHVFGYPARTTEASYYEAQDFIFGDLHIEDFVARVLYALGEDALRTCGDGR